MKSVRGSRRTGNSTVSRQETELWALALASTGIRGSGELNGGRWASVLLTGHRSSASNSHYLQFCRKPCDPKGALVTSGGRSPQAGQTQLVTQGQTAPRDCEGLR
jgi:hypothetical protein